MNDKKVVCASGYFDPLHVGHIDYLERAKSLGDKLVVIVNNDEQAKLKKGKEFMPLQERMRIISSLKFVDEVVASVDRDSTVRKSIEIVKPDIFAKGGDRFSGEIPEKEICDSLGIEIIDGLGEKIQSSSDLVKNFNEPARKD
jgi:rfaE bifunctional protein nucleotidyltransferase chain/domain